MHINFKVDRERYKTLQKVAYRYYSGCISKAIKHFIPETKLFEEIPKPKINFTVEKIEKLEDVCAVCGKRMWLGFLNGKASVFCMHSEEGALK